MLVGRGDLHPAVALRSQHLEALIRHGVVGPLEEVHDGLLLVLAVGLRVVIRHHRYRTHEGVTDISW